MKKILVALAFMLAMLFPAQAASADSMTWVVDNLVIECAWYADNRGITSLSGAYWSSIESYGCTVWGFASSDWVVVHAIKVFHREGGQPWVSFPSKVTAHTTNYRSGSLNGWPMYYNVDMDTLVAICKADMSVCSYPKST